MLLQHADAVVANAGTILLDALVNDRPAVCVLYDEGAPAGESLGGEERRRQALRGARRVGRLLPRGELRRGRRGHRACARRPGRARRRAAARRARGRRRGRRPCGRARTSTRSSTRSGRGRERSRSVQRLAPARALRAAGCGAPVLVGARTRRVRARRARVPARGRARPRDVPARVVRAALERGRPPAGAARRARRSRASSRRRVLSAGPLAAEVAMALLYALSSSAGGASARRLGSAVGIALARAPARVTRATSLLFHRLASDALFAAAFALAALLTARLVESPTSGREPRRSGSARAARPHPAGEPDSRRARAAASCSVRRRGGCDSGRLAVARRRRGRAARSSGRRTTRCGPTTSRSFAAAGQAVPLYRAFVVDGIVAPDNGEASRELARAVARDLLPREPYRSYGIDLDDVLRSRQRAHARGPDRPLRPDVGLGRRLRAPRARRPGGGSRASGRLRARRRARLLAPPLVAGLPPGRRERGRRDGTTARGVGQLPEPTEGQPIPSASVSASSRRPTAASARSGRRRPSTRSSPTIPSDAAHLDRLNRRVDELFARVLRPRAAAPSSAVARTARRAGSRGRRSGSLSGSSRSRSGGPAASRRRSCSPAAALLVSSEPRSPCPPRPSTRLRSPPRSSSSPSAGCSLAPRRTLPAEARHDVLARNEADIVDAQIAFHSTPASTS